MSFTILYVENNTDDFNDISGQVKKYNESNKLELPIVVERAIHPEDLKGKINLNHRVILSDIFYDDPETGTVDAINCLKDIISIVQKWSDENNGGKSIPVIAFSRRQEQKRTLREEDGLFDIWDKNTSSKEYVVWRLSKLAKEMSYVQPDFYLQNLIRQMETGPSWHEHTKMMAQKYHSGWTEFDQISKAGGLISEIAKDFETVTECNEMWKVMTKWEPISRAILPETRGHSRHVINVFWLGYYMINHPVLNGIFTKFWSKLLFTRGSMEEVSDVDYNEALNNVWFYASLFHDIGSCVEKTTKLVDFYNKLSPKIKSIKIPELSIPISVFKITDSDLKETLKEILNPYSELLIEKISSSFTNQKPDHGFIGAIHIINEINDGKQKAFAREASRAIAIHNVLGKLDQSISKNFSWETDPISCLLVVCDQLQTWDRERGDERQIDYSDLPTRAELLELNITSANSSPLLEISINYITKRHVESNYVIRERVRDSLRDILNSNPYRALEKIRKPWPLTLKVNFYMNRHYLTKLNF